MAKRGRLPKLDPAVAAQEILDRKKARRSLLGFCEYMHPRWETGNHHVQMCDKMDEVVDGRVKRLLVNLPPRHSKSEIVSRMFVPYYLAKNPDHQIILASYSDQMAQDNSRDARNYGKEQRFKDLCATEECFPGFTLDPETTAGSRWETLEGGIVIAAGIGGAITGRGAHCIAAGQRVLTPRGPVPIERVVCGDLVVTHKGRWRRVTAVADNGVRNVLRLTSSGARVICTPDHQLLTPGGWNDAGETKEAMGVQKVWSRVCTALAEQKNEVLLSRVQQDPREGKMGGVATKMQTVRGDYQQALRQRQEALLFQAVLLALCGRVRGKATTLSGGVFDVQDTVSAERVAFEVLLSALQERVSSSSDVGGFEPELQARAERWAENKDIPKKDASPIGKDGRGVFGVRFDEEATRSPYRREENESPQVQFDCDLSLVPHEVSQIEEYGVARVFDLEVEEDHSFVVEGFVAHNCAIVDDPLKDRQDADSARIRENVWKWYASVLETRLMPGGAIIVVQTRWHEDDLAGLLKKYQGGQWDEMSMPAIKNEGQKEEALWPERYSLEYLRRMRENYQAGGNVREWYSLYQQNPSPEEGTYCKREWYETKWDKRPTTMRIYMASDWAVTAKSEARDPDWTCHGVFGLADDDRIYVLDWWRGRKTPDETIAAGLALVDKWKPMYWWQEKGVIRRAIEGQLERTAKEKHISVNIEWVATPSDKSARGRAFQAWSRMNRVVFADAPWTAPVIENVIGFPTLRHDDDFDVMALICLQLDEMVKPVQRIVPKKRRDTWVKVKPVRENRWKVL